MNSLPDIDYTHLISEPQDIDSETYANSMGMTIINSLSGSDFHDLIAKLTTVLQDPHRRERGKVCIVCTCLQITQIWRTVNFDFTTGCENLARGLGHYPEL